MEGTNNINSLFFIWWYTEVFHNLIKYTSHFFAYLADLFSVKICLKTLLAPWKRDAIGYDGLSVQEKLQVLALNLTSRIVGAIVKIFTVTTFLVVFGCCLIFFTTVFIIWFFYPLCLIGLFVWGIKVILIG